MNKKGKLWLAISLVGLLVVMAISNISFAKIWGIPGDIYVSYQEVENANNEGQFGKFINIELKNNEVNTGDIGSETGEIVFKLFGLIPIKKVSVKIFPEEDVYVGGVPIGLSVNTEGAMVVSNTIIDTNSGEVLKNKQIEAGDIIQYFNNTEIKSVEDLTKFIHESKEENANITLLRNGKQHSFNVSLLKNENEEYKLGIWVRDNLAGIGTLTFVEKNTGKFGALGHSVTNGKDENVVPITEGEVFACNIVNIEKGEKNKPGELQCVFLERNRKGAIEKNTNVGIFGKLDNSEGLIDANKCAKLGGRLAVKPGEAKIISCVSGIREEYEIEIIKVNNQKSSSDKSFVFRVKDERLLALTGGIVQGMSGSPIMQNGKLIGAVTHVFIADSTKGYGVYSDWMLENIQ
ncbi:MAG: SpoIVB peptidase [Clostridia bacterium]|nr:SpoIVB peptidase [Clostridia bacterium]